MTTSTACGYPLHQLILEAAINAGNAQWVAQVIAAGADLSRRTTEPSGRCMHPGTTPLGLAIGNVEIVRMLLDAGAPVDQVAVRWGGTELPMAVVQSIDDGTVGLLLKCGANLFLTDAKGGVRSTT